MTLLELGALGEFLGAIVVMVTLIYLSVQVRQNNVRQKREETVSIQNGQNAVLAHMIDPTLVRAFTLTSADSSAATVEDRARTILWIIQYLNHFQTVYDLHRDGTLDEERYRLWEGFAVGMVASKGVRQWWDGENGKLGFMPKVRALIDERLDDEKNPPTVVTEMWSIFSAEAWSDRTGQ